MDWSSLKSAALSIGRVGIEIGRKGVDGVVSELSGIPVSVTDTVEVGIRQSLIAWHGFKAADLMKKGDYEGAIKHFVAKSEEITGCNQVLDKMYQVSQNYQYGDAYATVNDAFEVYLVAQDESVQYLPIVPASTTGDYSEEQLEILREAFQNSGYTEQQFNNMVLGGFAHDILLRNPENGENSGLSDETGRKNSVHDEPLAGVALKEGENEYSSQQKTILKATNRESGHADEHLERLYDLGVEKSLIRGETGGRTKELTGGIRLTTKGRNGMGGSVNTDDLRAVSSDLGKFMQETRELAKLMTTSVQDCHDSLQDDSVTPEVMKQVKGCADKLGIAMNKAEELQKSIAKKIEELESILMKGGKNA